MAEHIIHHDESNGMGFLLGVIVLIAVAFFLWMWGIPMMRENRTEIRETNTIERVETPTEIDVNVTERATTAPTAAPTMAPTQQ